MITTKCDSVVHHGVLSSPTNTINSQAAAATASTEPDPETAAARKKVMQSEADYVVWSNDYAQRIFEHQIWYTNVIFIIVNLLVLAGLYFAWLQFRATINAHQAIHRSLAPSGQVPATDDQQEDQKEEAAGPSAADASAFSNNTLKLGPDGLAISSAFIGLIILGFSMGFYLMYLKYVYPINEVGSAGDKGTNVVSTTAAPSR
jgi:hypothetical protein